MLPSIKEKGSSPDSPNYSRFALIAHVDYFETKDICQKLETFEEYHDCEVIIKRPIPDPKNLIILEAWVKRDKVRNVRKNLKELFEQYCREKKIQIHEYALLYPEQRCGNDSASTDHQQSASDLSDEGGGSTSVSDDRDEASEVSTGSSSQTVFHELPSREYCTCMLKLAEYILNAPSEGDPENQAGFEESSESHVRATSPPASAASQHSGLESFPFSKCSCLKKLARRILWKTLDDGVAPCECDECRSIDSDGQSIVSDSTSIQTSERNSDGRSFVSESTSIQTSESSTLLSSLSITADSPTVSQYEENERRLGILPHPGLSSGVKAPRWHSIIFQHPSPAHGHDERICLCHTERPACTCQFCEHVRTYRPPGESPLPNIE
ncbi:unnamed protein product [Caenorhabditis auriculariae]|uniref:Uncharacterized protein n=1 Tax=Caenorhabditis auriculariae TaxID=2777116 RepID=A0A8S1H101_9PELO|nr:unnamed protein product [Caenorhabditis auriculariae]